MKKTSWIALALISLAATGVMAEKAADSSAKATPIPEAEQATQAMTAVGTVVKHENKKKDGTPMMTWYRLVDAEGNEVHLPKGKIEDFVGAKVKVVGTGFTTEKKGKTVQSFKTITTIEKLEAPATPAK